MGNLVKVAENWKHFSSRQMRWDFCGNDFDHDEDDHVDVVQVDVLQDDVGINVRICWTNTHPIDPRTPKSLSTDNDGNLKSHINLTGDVKTNSSSCQAIVCWILSRDSDLLASLDENSQKCVTSYHSSNESWSSTNK